jgi:HlyD family secretion protein
MMRHIFTLLLCAVMFVSCRFSAEEYDASGVFETVEILVSSEISGRILSLNMEEGMTLGKGDVLGQIDSLQLHLQRQHLLANVNATQSRYMDIAEQVQTTRQQIATQQREYERFSTLLKDGATTQKTVDDLKASIDLLDKQLRTQETNLRQGNEGVAEQVNALQIQVAQLSDQLQKSRITSPIAGSVLAKYAEAGELAAPGKPLFKIANTDEMILRAYITSDLLTRLKIGQTLRVFADFGKEDKREYSGTVTWISAEAEFTPKNIQTRDERDNLVYAIKVAVKNDGYLKSGMYGQIQLKGEN